MTKKVLYEDVVKNKRVLGLVSLMEPTDLMRTLVKLLDVQPKSAAKMVLSLKRKAEGLSGGTIETNKEFPVPSNMRDDEGTDEEMEESSALARGNAKVSWGRPGPDPVNRRHFPPDPQAHSFGGKGEPDDEDDQDFPYGASFTNYMNGPKRKKPLTSGREPKVKRKGAFDVSLHSRQPGGHGTGAHSKVQHSRANDTPSGGRSWNRQGSTPGWAGSLKDNEFDPFQRRVAKQTKNPIPLEDKMANAGDDDDEPSIFKEPNTGGTIWDPKNGKSGTSNWRGTPWRGYKKR